VTKNKADPAAGRPGTLPINTAAKGSQTVARRQGSGPAPGRLERKLDKDKGEK